MNVVILAGGSGTRFWPLSRRDRPKQLLSLFGDSSLVDQTVSRVEEVCDSIHIVCRAGLVEPIKEAISSEKVSFIVEPSAKNTLPAIALAAAMMTDDAPIVVLPSDHYIRNEESFRAVLEVAANAATENDTIVTIGIEPTRPETGYGYIELKSDSGEEISKVLRFVEKPDLETAATYLAAGNFLWNAGMFVFRPSVLFAEMQRQRPTSFAAFETFRDSDKSAAAVAVAFEACESISVDFGIMEGAKDVTVIPGRFGWSDVGHWGAMFELLDADDQGNIERGDAITINTRDSLIWANSRTVATVGVSNIVVIETEDAVLVCDRNSMQSVREVVPLLKDFQK